MEKILKMVKKSTAGFMLLAFTVGSFGLSSNQLTYAATTWNTTGAYVININYLGTDYTHDMSLVQDGGDNLTGNGGSPAGANTFIWAITSGAVTNSTIDFLANYTATPDAVTPQTTMHVIGTIAGNGTISGTWSDNYQGNERAGTFTTVSGTATLKQVEEPPATVKVTILKYVDGATATTENANASDFPMSATWNAINIGAGTGPYVLSENGFGEDTTPYQATSSDMETGASFSTYEITTTEVVGTSCEVAGTDYALVGYKHGNTLAEAQAATPSLVAPSFTNLTTDKFIIVLNEDCDNENDGYVTTNHATATSQTNATLNGTNGDNSAVGHSFWASLNTFSTASPTIPAGVYSTSDLGAITANTPFSASLSSTGITVTPNTTYYFAAWSNVSGTWYPGAVLSFITPGIEGEVIPGNGELEVTSIEMTDSTATANNSFEDGWKYVFNITVPTDETDLSMKFADWARTGGSEIIPVANNMRISSPQANNGGATVLITTANTYSTPPLTMITDLNPTLEGIQVKVAVEVKIPTGTTNGSYTTSYGVKTE